MDATPPSEAQHWQRTLWTMVGVQFVMSISFSILSPIMPLFLPELGVVSREAVSVWSGVLASVTSFIAIFTAPVWGSLADRHGRKLMVLRSTLGISVFTILMGVASNPWHMLAFRAGMGALAGFNSAATVLCPPRSRRHG
jgi:MFS transporter, DHA1 family, multidrug resistance protein